MGVSLRWAEEADFSNLKRERIDRWADGQPHEPWVGQAITAVDGKKVLGIAGLAVNSDGLASGWLLGSMALRKKPMVLHRLVKRALGNVLASEQVRRIEVKVFDKEPVTVRWVERLGFSPRGQGRYVMEKENG